MVHSVRSGRESLFEFDPEPIEEMKKYLDRVSELWDQALVQAKVVRRRLSYPCDLMSWEIWPNRCGSGSRGFRGPGRRLRGSRSAVRMPLRRPMMESLISHFS